MAPLFTAKSRSRGWTVPDSIGFSLKQSPLSLEVLKQSPRPRSRALPLPEPEPKETGRGRAGPACRSRGSTFQSAAVYFRGHETTASRMLLFGASLALSPAPFRPPPPAARTGPLIGHRQEQQHRRAIPFLSASACVPKKKEKGSQGKFSSSRLPWWTCLSASARQSRGQCCSVRWHLEHLECSQ